MNEYYWGALDEGQNLTEKSVGFGETYFRSEIAAKIVQVLARQKCVLVVGPTGVGKTRIVHEVVSQLRKSGRAKVFEFSISQLLTGTRYLGEWETKANQIIQSAIQAKAILYFSDIWNLPSAAKASNRDVTAWNLIRPFLQQGQLQLIGEMTPDQLSGLSKFADFVTLFEPIHVEPLSSEQIAKIAAVEAKRLRLDADDITIERALNLCQQFLPANEGPGPVLELLAQIKDYQSEKRENNEAEELTPRFVEKVFSIYSGLPPIIVSPSVTRSVSEVTAWFEERIVGQTDAIRSAVESIALYKAGLHDPLRPIGSFLFVGPTGVGKTELARAIATYLFGSADRLLSFDLSEYKDYHSFQLLIGDPGNPSRPARLVDPVRARPFQVILLDEIEKAHPNVWDLLLQLLDEGRLTPAAGKPVNFRNTIVIATSNVGAKEQARESPGFVSGGQESASERVRQVLETAFRPELLNRFQHVCVFYRLTQNEVRQIAQLELRKVLDRQGISSRKIAVDIAPSVLDVVVQHGYDENYGARALRRMIQRYVSVPIATLLLEKTIEEGSILRLTAKGSSVKVDVVETAESKDRKAERVPLKTPLGRISTRGEIASLLKKLGALRRDLQHNVKPEALSDMQSDSTPEEHVWRDPAALAALVRQREVALTTQRRLDRLEERETELNRWLERAVTREERDKLVASTVQHELELRTTERELLVMPDGSVADALVELVQLGPENSEAIELFGVYSGWARERGYQLSMVSEPMKPTEPVVFGVSGHYAYGYMYLESGLHRFRGPQRNQVVRVRVFPWTDQSGDVSFDEQRALKKDGLLGGRVRSRLRLAGSELVLQNEKTLVENRSFAMSIVSSYLSAPEGVEKEVRRYDRQPFLIKDHLTGTSGRADTLAPGKFHELLCQRVDLGCEIRS